MAVDANEMISMASMFFAENVLETMKRARFCANDILNLTREDVDHEFREFRFGIRKSLWLFFKSLKEQNGTTQSQQTNVVIASQTDKPEPRYEKRSKLVETTDFLPQSKQKNVVVMSQTETAIPLPHYEKKRGNYMEASSDAVPEIAEVTSEIEDDTSMDNVAQEVEISSEKNASHDSSDGKWTVSVISSTPMQRSGKKRRDDAEEEDLPDFEPPPRTRKRATGDLKVPSSPYPKGMASPFPFNQKIKQYLANCKNFHSEDKTAISINHFILREVFRIAQADSEEKLTLKHWRVISQNLCIEYPCLLHQDSHMTVHHSLRKRVNARNLYFRELQSFSRENSAEVIDTKSSLYRPNEYPTFLPFPFPISPHCKEVLNTGIRLLKSASEVQKRFHCVVINEICWVLIRHAPGKLSLNAQKAVAQSLCVQYPVLNEELPSKEPWDSFYQSMRKSICYKSRHIPTALQE